MTSTARFLACVTVALLSLAVSGSALHAQSFSLRPGDAVRMFVPRDSGFSGTFEVDPDAGLTLPLIGRVSVAGQPWSQVHAQLLAALRRELREPGITLTPLRRVVVLGAVNRPGNYFIEPTATLAGAIAAAAGTTVDGSLKRVRITRDNSTFRADASPGSEIADISVESGDRIFVLQRSWFARNSNFLISAILSLTSIVVVIARR